DPPSQRGHADTVAVAGRRRHPADEEVAVLGTVQRAEPQGVQQRDRTRAHREDVAEDAPNPRRCALVRLDEGWMVVALHLEDGGQTVADVHGAGVLAGPLDDVQALCRELLKKGPRALIRTVLAP